MDARHLNDSLNVVYPTPRAPQLHASKDIAVQIGLAQERDWKSTMLSLNRLFRIRKALVGAKRFYLTKVWKMDIHPTADFSLSARFDTTYPAGVHVGSESLIAFGAVLLTHDTTRRTYRHTRVGNRCFIGARSIIMPGVSVGNDSIVGSGSVVTKDVPPGSIVAGNPAQVIRKISHYGETITRLDPYGRIPGVKG